MQALARRPAAGVPCSRSTVCGRAFSRGVVFPARTVSCLRVRSLRVLAHGAGGSPHGHGDGGPASPAKEKAEKEKGEL